MCKTLEQAPLQYEQSSSRSWGALVGWHRPDDSLQLTRKQGKLYQRKVAIGLPALSVEGEDPPLRRVVETGIDDDQVFCMLNAYGIIIDEDLNDLRLEGLLNIHAKVLEPNLPMLADPASQLAQPEDPAEADGVDNPPTGWPQDHLRRQIVDATLVVGPFVRPMTPELIILDELCVLAVHVRLGRTPDNVRIKETAKFRGDPLKPRGLRRTLCA